MKLKPLLITLILSGALSALSLCVYHRYYGKKTAYIEIKKVFESFQMKTDLQKKYKEVEMRRNRILDSLSFDLKVMSKHFNEVEFKEKIEKSELEQYRYRREEWMNLKNQYQQDNAALSQKYDDQILTRLTQYAIEFGKKYNYDMILGADGNGTLMYAKEANNISDEMIVFINDKYKGIE